MFSLRKVGGIWFVRAFNFQASFCRVRSASRVRSDLIVEWFLGFICAALAYALLASSFGMAVWTAGVKFASEFGFTAPLTPEADSALFYSYCVQVVVFFVSFAAAYVAEYVWQGTRRKLINAPA